MEYNKRQNLSDKSVYMCECGYVRVKGSGMCNWEDKVLSVYDWKESQILLPKKLLFSLNKTHFRLCVEFIWSNAVINSQSIVSNKHKALIQKLGVEWCCQRQDIINIHSERKSLHMK